MMMENNNKDFFLEIYRKSEKWVRSKSYFFTRNDSDADDLSQYIWTIVWKNIHKLQNKESYGPWLNRITYTNAVGFVQRIKSREKYIELVGDYWDTKNEVTLDYKEEIDVLFSKMSEKDSQILKDFYLGNYSIEELMVKNKTTKCAIKGRLHTARQIAKRIGV